MEVQVGCSESGRFDGCWEVCPGGGWRDRRKNGCAKLHVQGGTGTAGWRRARRAAWVSERDAVLLMFAESWGCVELEGDCCAGILLDLETGVCYVIVMRV